MSSDYSYKACRVTRVKKQTRTATALEGRCTYITNLYSQYREALSSGFGSGFEITPDTPSSHETKKHPPNQKMTSLQKKKKLTKRTHADSDDSAALFLLWGHASKSRQFPISGRAFREQPFPLHFKSCAAPASYEFKVSSAWIVCNLLALATLAYHDFVCSEYSADII